jgi:two-component system chemotaxis response regulator CheY
MLTGNSIILIIDTAECRSTLKKDLGALGYIFTIEASTLDEGLAKIEECSKTGKPISMIMCDWNSTKVRGESGISQLRASPLLKSIPIVMMSSNRDLSQALVSASAHINGYLVKPYNVEVLRNCLPMALAYKIG